jgi:DNA-binding transcriptional LysR family regulator
MDLKQLAYFCTIAEEGSISSAARILHISQPPLSHQLKLLEGELGVRLLERGPRSISLTEAGKLLYERAVRILSMADAAAKDLSDFSEEHSTPLRLGTTSSSGPALLNERIKEFHRLYPKVRFEIHEGNSFQILELLNNDIIGIGIARLPARAKNVECYPLEAEPMAAAGIPEFFRELPGSSIHLHDIKEKPFIIYRRFEELIRAAFEQIHAEPNIFCIDDDARTSMMWANAGIGIALIPQSIVQLIGLSNLSCRIIEDRSLYTQIAALWRKDRSFSTPAKNFMEIFRKKYDSDPKPYSSPERFPEDIN